MTQRLTDTVALITGASSGIGRATARAEIREMMASRLGDFERLEAADIAGAVEYIVTQPAHAAVNEVLFRPTRQVL
jgi:NADP-dependent 3-hydroxy acid dehydrogenase YdfG